LSTEKNTIPEGGIEMAENPMFRDASKNGTGMKRFDCFKKQAGGGKGAGTKQGETRKRGGGGGESDTQ
jgi:hypothetical protein